MPKNQFGDDVLTNQFGDPVVAEAQTPAEKPSLLDRFDAWMKEPVTTAPTSLMPHSERVAMTGESDPSGGTDMLSPLENYQATQKIAEMSQRYGIPAVATTLAPITGGGSYLLVPAAAATGEILAQKHEMDRGARDQASYGQMVAAPIIAGTPLGPLTKGAMFAKGALVASRPMAPVVRGAFGGLTGGVASAVQQKIDNGQVDLGDVANSAAFGALFGAGVGGLETMEATQAQKAALFALRKQTGNWSGTDLEFMDWLRQQAGRGPVAPNMPAEEGAPVSSEQIQAPAEPMPVPAEEPNAISPTPAVNAFGDPVVGGAPSMVLPQPGPAAQPAAPAPAAAPAAIAPAVELPPTPSPAPAQAQPQVSLTEPAQAAVGGQAPTPESVAQAGVGQPPEAPAPPAVKAVAPTSALDREVSQLVDHKQFKVQREYLLNTANKLLEAAPESGSGQVVIKVPGDGTYTIENSQPALQRFADNVDKRFGKSFRVKVDNPGRGDAYATITSPFNEGNVASRKAGPASPIPAIKANPTPADLGKAVGMAAVTDKALIRPALEHVLSDSGYSVATDGRRLFIATGGVGKTPEQITATAGTNFPNWRQVVPPWVKLENGTIRVAKTAPTKPLLVDTASAIKAINQVRGVLGEKSNAVALYDLGGGKIGFSGQSPDVGDYQSEGVQDGMISKAPVNPDYLHDVMVAARQAGHTHVKVYFSEDKGPVVAVGGDNFAAITMPVTGGIVAGEQQNPNAVAQVVAAPQQRPSTSAIGMPPPPPGTAIGLHNGGVMNATMQRTVPGTTSIRDVMDSYENVMRAVGSNAPIRNGRIAQRTALGIFKSWPDVIRLRQEGDIPTAAHEVAHAISKRIFGSPKSAALIKAIPFKQIAKELQALGKALYGSAKPAAGYTAEGFSELVRLWLTTEHAAIKAPIATGWLENTVLDNDPVLKSAMYAARDKTDIWRGQGAMERMNQQTAVEPGRIQKAVTMAKSVFSKRTLIEEFAPLEELAEGYEKVTGRSLPADQNPALIAQAYRRTAGAVLKQWVEDGVTDIAGNKVGPSLREAYARLKPSDEQPFHAYLFAKQAMIRFGQGKFAGIEKADAEWVIKTLETPAYVDAASKIADFWQAVRDYKREAYPEMNGPMIDAIETANPVYYGPLAAALDVSKVRRAVSTRTGGGLYRFTGHGGPTKRMYEQSLFVAENIIGSAQRDLVLRSIMQLRKVENLGWLAEEVPVAKVMEKVNIEKLRKQLEGWGINTDSVPPDTLLEFATQMDEPKGSDPIIAVREQVGINPDGSPRMQQKWMQVPREVQEVIQGVHEPERLGPLFELLIGGPTRMFKLGTTGLRAGFSLITNPERDLQTFMMQSIATNPALKASVLFNAYRELVTSALTGNPGPYLKMFHQMGISGSNFLGGDIAQAKREAKGLFHGKHFKLWTSPIESLREAMSFTESAPRLAELQLASKHFGWTPGQPLTLEQAVQIRLAAKRITTDFSAKGNMPPLLRRGLLGPFFNASVQGLRAFGRTFQDNQGTFRRNRPILRAILNALTLITLPVLWNWYNNRNKEWYRMLPWRERYLYINVESGSNVIQIPLPQEWGIAFGVLPVAVIDSLWKQDPQPIEQALKHAFAVLNPVDWPTPVAALKEQWQNKVDFFNQPIVPKSEVDLMPGAQRGPYSSWFAKTLGDAFPETISPRRVDAAIRETFGGAGSDYSRIPDMLMSKLGITPDTRSAEASDLPIVGRQFRHGGTFSAANQSINDFWDDQQRYSAWLAATRHSGRAGEAAVLPMPDADQRYAMGLNAAAPWISMALRAANATQDMVARQRLYQAVGRMTEQLTSNRPPPATGVIKPGTPGKN